MPSFEKGAMSLLIVKTSAGDCFALLLALLLEWRDHRFVVASCNNSTVLCEDQDTPVYHLGS